MKEEYITPDFSLFLYCSREDLASGATGESDHDNGYIDWFADPDAARRGTKE